MPSSGHIRSPWRTAADARFAISDRRSRGATTPRGYRRVASIDHAKGLGNVIRKLIEIVGDLDLALEHPQQLLARQGVNRLESDDRLASTRYHHLLAGLRRVHQPRKRRLGLMHAHADRHTKHHNNS